ncbi:MAG: LAGLIDADG family homing endonuclease [Fimbriimonadaceae bacterium]
MPTPSELVADLVTENREWCHWFVGLCDGEASFTMRRGTGCYLPRFKLCMLNDFEVISDVHRHFGFGHLTKLGGKRVQCEWDVPMISGCKAVAEFFALFPLHSSKKTDSKLWEQFVDEAEVCPRRPYRLNALALHLTLTTGRRKGQSFSARVWLRYWLTIRADETHMSLLGLAPPGDHESARRLAHEDGEQFRGWALGLVEAPPSPKRTNKKSEINFDGLKEISDSSKRTVCKIVVKVKDSGLKLHDIHALDQAREKHGAHIAAFVLLDKPDPGIIEAAEAMGSYKNSEGKEFRRIQLLSIEGLLDGTEHCAHP